MKKLLVVLSVVFSLLLVSSCQKGGLLEGTWARLLQENYSPSRYEFIEIGRNGKVTMWYETGDGIKLDQYVPSHVLLDGSHIAFSGFDLWLSEDNTTLSGTYALSAVAFYRQ